MGKFRFNITVSLDGYVAGPHQSIEHPLGVGAEHLHDWAFATKWFREMHGMEGGETGLNDDVAREWRANIGAEIMGRNMFGGGRAGWGDGSWRGWWGEDPPFHTPVFVLTHHPRELLQMQGGTTFCFVTDGIESALRQARAAAGDKDVVLGGGANVAQQYLAAGLLDEIQLHLVPQILGGGERLFEGLDGATVRLDPLRTLAGPGVTHLKYRILK